MTTELYKAFRPKLLKHVYGQPEAVSMLSSLIAKNKVPHTMLFCGPSGCGKTTLARILASKLDCGKDDFTELNCADFRGIDMVRDIRSRMSLSALSGACRVWCIDECHELTKQAQDAFLKVLEDTPSHVYFFLATTDPAKLLPTIRSRCTEIKVKALAPSVMTKMLGDVCKRAKAQMPSDVLDKIVNLAEGGARKALVLLNQVMELTSEDAQLAALEQSDAKHASIEIARALINPRCTWGDVSKLIKAVDDEPEQIRRLVLGYCSSIVLGGGKLAPRAISVIYNFSGNFYDSGKAGLVFAAWNVINSK